MTTLRMPALVLLTAICIAGCSRDPLTPEEQFNELAQKKEDQIRDFLQGKGSELRNYTVTVANEGSDRATGQDSNAGVISFEYVATSFREKLIHGFSAHYRYSAEDKRWNYVRSWQSKGKDGDVAAGLLVRHSEIKSKFEQLEE